MRRNLAMLKVLEKPSFYSDLGAVAVAVAVAIICSHRHTPSTTHQPRISVPLHRSDSAYLPYSQVSIALHLFGQVTRRKTMIRFYAYYVMLDFTLRGSGYT